MSEGVKAVEEAKEFIDKYKPDLVISDVPKKTLRDFKELADLEFSTMKNTHGHYGYCLKFLLDFYLGYLGKGHERAEAMANEALEQIAVLRTETKDSGTQEKKIKLCNGKELRVN